MIFKDYDTGVTAYRDPATQEDVDLNPDFLDDGTNDDAYPSMVAALEELALFERLEDVRRLIGDSQDAGHALEALAPQFYDTEGFKERIIAFWEVIRSFFIRLWGWITATYRAYLSKVVAMKRRAVSLKKRASDYLDKTPSKTRTDITKWVRQVTVADNVPKDIAELTRSLQEAIKVADKLTMSGLGKQADNVYEMIASFNPSNSTEAAAALIEFALYVNVISSDYSKTTLSNNVHPEIRKRTPQTMAVSSIEIFNNRSIVSVVPIEAKSSLSKMELTVKGLTGTAGAGAAAEKTRLISSLETVAHTSRELRKMGTSVEGTFNFEKTYTGDTYISTTNAANIGHMADVIIDLADKLLEYTNSREVRDIIRMSDKIRREGDRVAKRVPEVTDTRKDAVFADIWREMANWASWYAKAAAAYQPRVVANIVTAGNAAVAIGNANLSNLD